MFSQNKEFFKGAAVVGGITIAVTAAIVIVRKFF